MKYQNVDTIVYNNWRCNHQGTNMFQILRKLKSVNREVKDWSKRNFGNFNEKLTKNTEKIDNVEERLIANPNSYRFTKRIGGNLHQRIG